MKSLGLALLIFGVGVCAAFGARNVEDVQQRTATIGRADLLIGAAAAELAEYCVALEEAQLPPTPECAPEPEGEADAQPPAEEPEEETAAPTYAEWLSAEQARIVALRMAQPHETDEPIAEARAEWIAAEEVALRAAADKRSLGDPMPAPERLSRWFAAAGAPFAVGFLFVIAGAIISRRAIKAELVGDDGDEGGAVDFGALLSELVERTEELAEELGDATLDEAAAAAFRERLDALEMSHVEPLVAARERVQFRYGVGGFAAIFSPLSAGERKLNRAWSALADGHWPEATDSLEAAARSFTAARAELERQMAAA